MSTVEVFRKIEGFLAPGEVEAMLAVVRRNQHLFASVHGKLGLGPRYRVIDGDQILSALPEVAELGDLRVKPAIEEFAAEPLVPLGSSRRAMRVQSYRSRDDGFRWHFDAHAYVALLTLENGNGGATQFLSARLSRFVRWVFYPLYFLPQLASVFPRETIVSRAGDLLLMRGAHVLHRGITGSDDGDRVLLAFTYDPPGKRPNWLRDAVARRLNY